MASDSAYPIIVSYFTPDSPYEMRAQRLRQSAEKLRLDCIIEPRESRGSWVDNCAQKAHFIKEAWHSSGRPICWVDADAVILRKPEGLRHFRGDFAVVKRAGWNFFSGQVAFNKTTAALSLIERWCSFCVDFPHVWDQVSLGYAWWEMEVEKSIRAVWLEERIFAKASSKHLKRLRQRLLKQSVFLHYQEGRRSKGEAGEISSNGHREFTSDHIPEWWRRAARVNAPFALSAGQRDELGLVAQRRLSETQLERN